MKHKMLGIGVTALALSSGPVEATSDSVTQGGDIRARVAELCKDPSVLDCMTHLEEVCEISTDDGKTWKRIATTALATLALAGGAYLIRSRRKKEEAFTLHEARDFHGENFHAWIEGNDSLTTATSDGGKEFMEDYVTHSSDENMTKMIVLDGVWWGDRSITPWFVACIGEKLKDVSLGEFLDQKKTHLHEYSRHTVGTTVCRAVIKGDVLSMEKIGDVGIVVFDQRSNIVYQNIGGWFVPDYWYGSHNLGTLEEKNEILRKIQRDFGIVVDHKQIERMTRSEFAKRFWYYTMQVNPSQADYPMTSKQLTLSDGDTVIMATDGVFDNISVSNIVRCIQDQQGSMRDKTESVVQLLDEQCSSGISDFWEYKNDNIGISIYRHKTSKKVSKRGVELTSTLEQKEKLVQYIESLFTTYPDFAKAWKGAVPLTSVLKETGITDKDTLLYILKQYSEDVFFSYEIKNYEWYEGECFRISIIETPSFIWLARKRYSNNEDELYSKLYYELESDGRSVLPTISAIGTPNDDMIEISLENQQISSLRTLPGPTYYIKIPTSIYQLLEQKVNNPNLTLEKIIEYYKRTQLYKK